MIKEKLRPYFQALPDVFNYQIASKALLAVLVFLLGRIFQALLRSSGRVAVTSGDWIFLFTTWQGILILLLGLVTLFFYVAFDINSKIIISRNLLIACKSSLTECTKEAAGSIGKLFNLRGILVVIYIALIAPIVGIGVSISLTEGLYIPTFISSFIESSVLYSALAGFAVLVFLSVGIANLFILHGIIIDGLSIEEAGDQSRKLIRANWKDYLKQNVVYILTISLSLAAVAVLCLFIPLKLISMLPAGAVSRFLIVFFVVAGVIISLLADMFGTPLYLLKMTQLYYSYKQGSEFVYREKQRENLDRYKKAAIAAVIAVIAAVFIIVFNFDKMFPLETNVKVIAHRAGGIEGPENTISGLEAAQKAGAYGSEIDIQRTKDGAYVILHDGTFKRVAGVKKKPSEMTLDEIKELSVDGEPVPVFEDMLAACKGRTVLFTELKGKSADRKMADDAVKLIHEYQMEDECVLISLKYDVIDYIESTYPDIQTGFLTFASFGNTASLNCDYIGLEEESATTDAINSIHTEGKQALVWTPNKKGSQKQFLCSQADGIITDKVSQAIGISEQMLSRSDLDRMVDKIKAIL